MVRHIIYFRHFKFLLGVKKIKTHPYRAFWSSKKYLTPFKKNFLDVGGVANAETVAHGFKIILSDTNVKSVLINIFGGIVRCDRVAQGVIDALSQVEVNVPVVIRLEGTNAEDANKLLNSRGISS